MQWQARKQPTRRYFDHPIPNAWAGRFCRSRFQMDHEPSEKPAEADAKQTANERPHAKHKGTQKAFLRQAEPHVQTTKDHVDQTGRDGSR